MPTLPKLRDPDVLGRGVFSRKNAKRARRGIINHHIFLEKLGVDSLSVDRLDHATDDEMAEIGDQRAHLRKGIFCGWATVTVEQSSKGGRSVCPTEKSCNPYHADIYLNISPRMERRDSQKKHAVNLAALARWRPRP